LSQHHDKLMEILATGKLCPCVDPKKSASHLHGVDACEEPRLIVKRHIKECDVAEFNGLSICCFCFFTIPDDGAVAVDKKHKHVHFLDGAIQGNYECKQK